MAGRIELTSSCFSWAASTAFWAVLSPRSSDAIMRVGDASARRSGLRPMGPRAPASRAIAAQGDERARGPAVISRPTRGAAARKEISLKRARAPAWAAALPGEVSAGARSQSTAVTFSALGFCKGRAAITT